MAARGGRRVGLRRGDSDESLVMAVRQGRVEAYSHLVDRHQQRVYAVLMRLVADPQTAEELAHEAFVRAYRGLDGFRGEARFGTWVVQIAIHLARDEVRRRKRHPTVSLEELVESPGAVDRVEELRSSSDPFAAASERETMERFEVALDRLPPSYREVFVLHHLEDMPYEEIAVVTGDSVGSLKVRAHRARRLLKEAVFPEEKDVAGGVSV
jgi:RNA polymerase sigma-70 factor (ECF subfamily)